MKIKFIGGIILIVLLYGCTTSEYVVTTRNSYGQDISKSLLSATNDSKLKTQLLEGIKKSFDNGKTNTRDLYESIYQAKIFLSYFRDASERAAVYQYAFWANFILISQNLEADEYVYVFEKDYIRQGFVKECLIVLAKLKDEFPEHGYIIETLVPLLENEFWYTEPFNLFSKAVFDSLNINLRKPPYTTFTPDIHEYEEPLKKNYQKWFEDAQLEAFYAEL